MIISITFLILMVINLYNFLYALTQSKRSYMIKASLLNLILTIIISYTLSSNYLSNKLLKFLIAKNIYNSFIFNAITIIFLIVLSFITICIYNKEKQYLETTVRDNMIKESIDTLPMGLCFYKPNGMLYLSNDVMNNLSLTLTKRELLDGNYFYDQILENDSHINPVEHILFLNAKTYSFSKKDIVVENKKLSQIVAVDISELYRLQLELKSKNKAFKDMNKRLFRYSEDLFNIKVKEERLALKTLIHNEFGYLLLATRRLFENNPDNLDKSSIFNSWTNNINLLLSGIGLNEKNVVEEMIMVANDIGVELTIEGLMPDDESVKEIILSATIEALNNAVRHADASKLSLIIKNNNYEYVVELINNGKSINKQIEEAGGLSALRKQIEDFGGVMEIIPTPIFTLKIILPNRRGLVFYD